MTANTLADLKALAERNAQRAEEAKAKLGTKYLCHPVHRVQRLSAPPEQGLSNQIVLKLVGIR